MNDITSQSREKLVLDTLMEENIRILHVDDEEYFLNLTKKYLRTILRQNWNLDSFINPKKALEQLKEKAYDAIISDYQMPGMTGLELLEALRNQNVDTPFIIFTGREREEVVVKALNLGANYYIHKDADLESQFGELAHTIRTIVHHRHIEKALKESEEKYRNLVTNSLQGTVIAQGNVPHIVFVNPAIAEMLGYTIDELLAFTPNDMMNLIHPDDRNFFFKGYRDRLTGVFDPDRYELRFLKKDGSVRWFEIFANYIKYSGEPAVQGTFIDITERRLLMSRLDEFKDRLNSIEKNLQLLEKKYDTKYLAKLHSEFLHIKKLVDSSLLLGNESLIIEKSKPI
ncbi:MAG: response regulator [Candidatus Hodarchaeota archaeon]